MVTVDNFIILSFLKELSIIKNNFVMSQKVVPKKGYSCILQQMIQLFPELCTDLFKGWGGPGSGSLVTRF